MPEFDHTRRSLLASGAAAISLGFAGCIQSGGGDSDGQSNESTTGSDSSSEGGDGASSFDPANPEFPQPMATLISAGFETGSLSDLENMEEREKPRYGKPVKETPSKESELLDPDKLAFAMTPSEDPAAYRTTMKPLMDNIAKETGKEVEYFPLQSYASQVEAMRSERLHIAGFSTGPTPFAVNLAGAVPFSLQVSGEGDFGYRLWLATQADNDDINSLSDLQGKRVAHSEPSSNSGNQAPRALFANQGVVPGDDYEVAYSGGHEQSVLGVANGDYDAAPVCSTCVTRVANAGNLDPSNIKVVWASNPFPTTSFTYRYNLTPEIQEGIRAAFTDYDYSDTQIAETFEGRGKFTEIDYATAYDIILQIQENNGVEYQTDNLGE
ncbi:putative phosphonate ABC transporter, periplasmic phosphonate-binding protein [Haloferax mucosum ATCC BAA-1512]|uniref:Putative phosphonate ABC transporter, periplasmic phosphonate-binding protein n=1 Tax=Haloferax mucosum ATCC BAA-1512 TaxID=662479 RepID=M0ILY4_9EURY|nr:phosphate/phosphite/phosphonate ABC transporter substrate-binding protein [Haloferax mucosum]ELZ97017.1 putative phosphonate ABC transporter, periplasmic phosphonate-binding protein [Haloferax mucosum ATCC BAA-1512]